MTLSHHHLRQVCLAAFPELAAAYQLAERVAKLNPDDGGMLADLVGTARAIANGHSPRDALRVSHAELQERLTFMMDEYGNDLAKNYPGTARITREDLTAAGMLNPSRDHTSADGR